MDQNRAHCNGVHGRAKRIKLVIPILFLILAASQAAALSMTVEAPEFVREGDLLRVNFTATPVDANTTYSIYRNGVQVASTNEFEWDTTNNDSGTYTFRFEVNNTNESAFQERVVEVLDEPLIIDIRTPAPGVITNDEVRISVETTPQSDSCTYTIDGSTGSLNKAGSEWYKILLLGNDRVYNLTVSCISGSDQATKSRIFILDTQPPVVTSKSPEGSYTGTPVPLEVQTDENSICRYGREDVSYNQSSSQFSQTGGTEHKQIVNIERQEDITFYVACKDRHGNAMQSNEEITFFANLKPTASITIEEDNTKEDLLKPGTYEVRVKTSEPVLNPKLQYEFSQEGKKKEITLEGSDTEWEGFISIGENIQNDIGTFYFEATDMTDLKGSQITQGKIFLVDTLAPEAVESVKITRQGLDVRLEWLYEGEAIDHFEIYRDETKDVDKLDKWDETVQEEYLDENTLLGSTYYYRVAAVDKAGNVGELSPPVNILIEYNESVQTIDPIVARKINQTQELLQRNVFDIETSLNNLKEEDDRAALEVIRQLDLISRAENARNSIRTLINELEKMKVLGLSEEEVNKRINVFVSNADKEVKKVAQNIEILDSTTQDQTLVESEIEQAINEVLVGIDLNQEQREEYRKNILNIQDRTTVTASATTARINYLNTPAPQEITLIHKKIITEVPVKEGVIVEDIPKEVARRDNEIVFEKKPQVLKPDLVVKWEHKDLTSTDIYYYVEKLVEISDAVQAKTVVLERPQKPKDNQITGAITGPAEQEDEQDDSSYLLQIIVFLGAVLSAGLLIYYVAYVKDGEIHQTHSIIPRQQPTPNKSHPISAIEIHRKLKQGHSKADDTMYEEALQTYKEILGMLEKEKKDLSKEYVKKLEENTRRLYHKLMLLLKIRKAHHNIDSGDVKGLKDTLFDIKKLYQGLGEETELAQHVRKSYSYFLNHMRGMDREEFFKKLEL